MLVCSPAPCPPFKLDRVSSEACACVCSQLLHALGYGRWPCPVRSPSAVWPHSCPPWPPWLLRMMSGLSWKRLRNLWSRSLPRGLLLASRTSDPARAPALPCPRPLPVVFAAPSCSISVAPRVSLSRALLFPRLIARSPLAATPAPRPLPTGLLSHGAGLAWLAAPLRVSHVPQPLLPPRPLLGRQVRGVVLRPASRAMWACCAGRTDGLHIS